jgi:hypothetical protein
LDVNAAKEYKDILLLDAGKSIAIQADTQGITDQAAMEAALRELAARQKLVVDPAATMTLRFYFHESTLTVEGKGVLKILTPTMTLTDSAGQEHWRQRYGEFKFELGFDGAAWIKKHSLPGRLYTKPQPTIFKRPAGDNRQ